MISKNIKKVLIFVLSFCMVFQTTFFNVYAADVFSEESLAASLGESSPELNLLSHEFETESLGSSEEGLNLNEIPAELEIKALTSPEIPVNTFSTLTTEPEIYNSTNAHISPKSGTIKAGDTLQFSATPANASFEYSITGNTSQSTTIDNNGLLYVANDETAATITVNVIATGNSNVFNASTEITILYPIILKSNPSGVPATFSGEGYYAVGEEVNISVNASGYDFINWSAKRSVTFSPPNKSSTYFTMIGGEQIITANFKGIIPYSLTTSVSGGGSVSPGGSYVEGSSIKLVATPNANSVFSNWDSSGGGTLSTINSTNTVFTMPGNSVNVTAVFVPKTLYNLNLVSSNGVVIGSGSFYEGQQVKISVIPNQNFVFSNWSSNNGGTIGNPLSASTTFRMPAGSVTLTATCTQSPQYQLTVLGANGTVTGSGTFFAGQTARLTASANQGYAFVNWSSPIGSFTNANASITGFIMPAQNVTVNANFVSAQKYTLTVQSPNGTTTGSGSYYGGQIIPIRSIPNSYYRFSNWSASIGSVANPSLVLTTYKMPAQNVTITANMVPEPKYTLTVVGPNGTVTGSGDFYEGDIVPITAQANLGYTFVEWQATNGYLDKENSPTTSFQMPGTNVTVTAIFSSSTKYNLAVNSSNGTAYGSGSFYTGQKIYLSVTPNKYFSAPITWSASDGSPINPIGSTSASYIMPASNVSITATCTPMVPYTINYNSSLNITYGSISVNGVPAASSTLYKGDTVSLTAIPNSGFVFLYWYSSNGGKFTSTTLSTTQFTMPESNTTVTAVFAPATKYNLSVTTQNGTVTGSGNYTAGSTVTVSATPDPNYHFVGWATDDGGIIGDSSAPNTIFTMPSNNVNLVAVFAENEQYTLSINGINGSATGAGTYYSGEQIVLRATPNPGYKFLMWQILSGGKVSSTRSETTVFTMPDNIALVQAICVPSTQYSLTVTSSTGGIATGTGSYLPGLNVPIKAFPNPGYNFVGWKVLSGGGNIDQISSASTTFTMPSSNATIEAVFEPKEQYKLIIYGPNGTVSGSGFYYEGQDVAINAVPNSGYNFVNWSSSNGGIIQNPSSASTKFKMPASDASLLATFSSSKTYALTVSGLNGTVIGSGQYNEGQKIFIYAIPDVHYHFVGWIPPQSGSIANISSSATTFTMPAGNVKVSAIFQINPKYELSEQAPFGTVTGLGAYHSGELVDVQAVPDSGYAFLKWSNQRGGKFNDFSSSVTTFIMPNNDEILTPIFVPNVTHNLTVTASVGGTATGTGSYLEQKDVAINATPNSHYKFVGWETLSGSRFSDPLSASSTYKMPAYAATIRAVFEPEEQYSLKVITDNGSTVSVGSFYPGDQIPLLAYSTPGANRVFLYWKTSDGGVFSDDLSQSSTYTMPSNDVLITGVFTSNIKFPVQVLAEDGTTTGSGMYYAGQKVTISAVPNNHYQFITWRTAGKTVFANMAASTTSFTMPANPIKISAIMTEEPLHFLTVIGPGGTVSGSGSFYAGDNIPITASPDGGNFFVNWVTVLGSVDNPLLPSATYTMPDENTTVLAQFNPKVRYKLEIVNNYGTSIGSGDYYPGESVNIKVSGGGRQIFDRWIISMEDSSIPEPIINRIQLLTRALYPENLNATFIMPASNISIESVFADEPSYKIFLDPKHGIVITPGPYYEGMEILVSANIPSRYRFGIWLSSAGSYVDDGVATTKFIMPAQDVILSNIVNPSGTTRPYFPGSSSNQDSDSKIPQTGSDNPNFNNSIAKNNLPIKIIPVLKEKITNIDTENPDTGGFATSFNEKKPNRIQTIQKNTYVKQKNMTIPYIIAGLIFILYLTIIKIRKLKSKK